MHLHDLLEKVDTVSAEKIHFIIINELIRALSNFTRRIIIRFPSTTKRSSTGNLHVSFRYFVLNDEREKLYQKIELRVDEMVQNGLIDEVKHP